MPVVIVIVSVELVHYALLNAKICMKTSIKNETLLLNLKSVGYLFFGVES